MLKFIISTYYCKF